jgi:7-cyano-7-deazaguanine synthase
MLMAKKSVGKCNICGTKLVDAGIEIFCPNDKCERSPKPITKQEINKMFAKKIVAEFSGGADSAAAVILAKLKWPHADIWPIFVDYGQPYMRQELAMAKHLVNKLNILPLKIVKIDNLFTMKIEFNGLSSVYTPLRNMLLLSVTASYANMLGAEIILTGSKGMVKVEGDPYSYYDSTVPFYTLMENVINYCNENKEKPIKVVPILTENRTNKMTKLEVYRILGTRRIYKDETWSCFTPTPEGLECGECHNCKVKALAYQQLDSE